MEEGEDIGTFEGHHMRSGVLRHFPSDVLQALEQLPVSKIDGIERLETDAFRNVRREVYL